MKRFCLLLLLIVPIIASLGQNVPYSSWYNEYTHENVSYNLGNGATFKGTKDYHKGTFLSFRGTITYANGDTLSGLFDENFQLKGDGTYHVKVEGAYWGGYSKTVHMENGRIVEGSRFDSDTQNTVNTNPGTTPHNDNYTNPVKKHEAQCQGCHGTGKCRHCGGTGYVNNYKSKCSLCHGTGRCQSCAGVGKIYL